MAKRNVLITGAGSGLGRGLTVCLAQAGHSIIATDIRLESAQETVSQIKSTGGEAEGHCLDVTSEQDIERFIRNRSEIPIGTLINNAGLQHVAKLEEFPIEKWDLLIDVMLKGPFLMTRAVLPGMRSRGFGRIINIGSIHSLVGSPFKSGYVAAKHALLGFAKAVALETAGLDITINTLCPAYIRTPLVDAQIKDQAKARGIPEDEVIQQIMLRPMPKQAFITFEEVAAAAEYLMSPMARNVTGQTITIDGGWTAQ
jgi:3-hydroxybutyrate dehydrogenase